MARLDILLTGASGFVGSALVSEMRMADFSGIAVSRRELMNFPNGWNYLHRDSVLDRDLTDTDVRPNCDVHLEVKQHVQNPTTQDLAEFQEINVGGTQR